MSTGLPPGFKVSALTLSGQNLFVGSSDSCVFISTNSGATWTSADSGLPKQPITCFALSNTNLFLGSWKGIFLSANNGASWSYDGLDFSISSLAVSGANIFCATGLSVWLSNNNGSTWTLVDSGMGPNPVNTLFVFGPYIFAGTPDGVFRSANNIIEWVPVKTGMPALTNIWCFANVGTTLFAGTQRGLYVSSNNGTNWNRADTLFADKSVLSLAVLGENIFAGIYTGGIYLSTDKGNTWNSVSDGLPTQATVTAFAISDSYLFAGVANGYYTTVVPTDGAWRRSLSELIP